jgi:hypothetical protein
MMTLNSEAGMPSTRGLRGHVSELASAFVEGALRPSLPACLGTLALVATQTLILSLVVSEETVARLEPTTLMSGVTDWDAYITVKALALKHREDSNPVVVCTGDSLIMAAVDDPADVARELRSSVGPVDFEFLATYGQSLWDTVTILDQLPKDARGAVVIGVSPVRMMDDVSRLRRLASSPRLALSSPAFEDEARRAGQPLPWRTGVYFLDHSRWFAARPSMVLGWLTEPVEPDMHYVVRLLPAWKDEDWEKPTRIASRLSQPENMPSMFAMLERAVRRLQARENVRVAVLEMPRHPRLAAVFRRAIEEYQTRICDFAERMKVAHWRLDDEARLAPEDFSDPVHISNAAARRRFQRVLTRRIKELCGFLQEDD